MEKIMKEMPSKRHSKPMKQAYGSMLLVSEQPWGHLYLLKKDTSKMKRAILSLPNSTKRCAVTLLQQERVLSFPGRVLLRWFGL